MQIIVHAHPNSKKPRIQEKGPGVFDIYVAESATDGKANAAILKELAGYLDVAPSLLTIKRGQTSKVKYITVE
ncbi:MAG TPA: DUF167 domain-containing protein [Patescibacteria group bacterium]|jgi:hypothetical protein|nr:DUF167 domain-containing protein [Patescibacteria group bacterium]